MFLLSWLVEKLAFKQQHPLHRASYTVGTAWLLGSGIAGFGMADGGAFVPTAGLLYIPGALITWFLYLRRYRKAWEIDAGEAFH